MKRQKASSADQIIMNRQFTLLELLDRLLDKGVVVKGEILLSVADVDLVYLNLGLLLSSVKTAAMAARSSGYGDGVLPPWQPSPQEEFLYELQPEAQRKDAAPLSLTGDNGQRVTAYQRGQDATDVSERREEIIARQAGEHESEVDGLLDYGSDQFFAPRTNIDPKNVERGLAKLVLTLVDLIRKLMEKQAIRRLEAGQLDVSEIEKMGSAFLLLDEKMEQLKKIFELKDGDLNLDLGPLGELI